MTNNFDKMIDSTVQKATDDFADLNPTEEQDIEIKGGPKPAYAKFRIVFNLPASPDGDSAE